MATENTQSNNTETSFRWRNQSTFVVISVGAMLSLKDFLTFPVMAGENGGGAFLLMYSFFLLLLGLPLLMSELMLGRMTRSNLVAGLGQLAEDNKASSYWRIIGVLALLAGFLILSAYSVISGWSLSYFVKSALGVYASVTPDGVNSLFNSFQADTEAMMLWHTLFVILLVVISAQELKLGLQRIFMIIVPLMALLLLVGLVYAFYSGGMVDSIKYILYPDWSKVDSGMPLLALQRAFFTLALGLGVMVIYGAYVDDDVSIGYASGQIIVIDLLFSIITGLAINALVFSVDVAPVLDDELAFRILPVIFGSVPYGALFAALFYLLLSLAAITTGVAIVEAILASHRKRFNSSRLRSAAQIGFAIWLLGLGTIFSYSVWNKSGFTMTLYFGDQAHRVINEAAFHDVIIYLSSHILQPMVALFIALFVGWVLPRAASFEALNLKNRKMYEAWNFTIRYITPILVFIVMLSTLGIVGN